jgi:hypothetical protein
LLSFLLCSPPPCPFFFSGGDILELLGPS